MKQEEFDFILMDRIAKIQAINEQYDLEKNSYIAHSGGKDSCVLSDLIDRALPNNHIKRVKAFQGIEFPQMNTFYNDLMKQDTRFSIIKPTKNIKKILNSVGYPFKSKQHSHNFQIYKNNIDLCDRYINIISDKKRDMLKRIEEGKATNGDIKWISNIKRGASTVIKYYFGIRIKKMKYIINGREREREQLYLIPKYAVPEALKFQFTKEYAQTHNFSDKCCYEFKKDIFINWEKENNIDNCFTGQRRAEGGAREQLKCVSQSHNGKHLNVLAPLDDEFVWQYISTFDLKLCELYRSPFNFERTGCMGCPFNEHLQDELNTLYLKSPKTYYQCLHVWKPVYDEYVKIGYRLKYYPHTKAIQMSIFDFIEEGE